MDPPVPSKDEYTVGWIAALSLELTAAIRMLDSRYPFPSDFFKSPNDPNVYIWGRIGDHNVVITFLEAGAYGTTPAATTATYLLSAFPNIKIGLMVGIGAGVRRKDLGFDVRLGDVVISQPDGKSGGVYQYDLQKVRTGKDLDSIGNLNRPSTSLLKVLNLVKSHQLAGESKVSEYLRLLTPEMADPPNGDPGFVHQGLQNDRLFKSTFPHVSAPVGAGSENDKNVDLDADDSDSDSDQEAQISTCPYCPYEQEVKRKRRKTGIIPQFHYGTIASGNTLIKDAEERDRIVKRVPGNCICFEMEAAGLMNNFPCLVIRGICDYADSHKNNRWQPYAALTAAAYAKEFLMTVPSVEVQVQTPLARQLEGINEKVDDIRNNVTATTMEEQLEKLTDWLSPPDPSSHYLTVLRERNKGAVGSGRWFVRNAHFSRWISTKKSFLWLHGRAGCGKTVLCSTAIEYLRAANSPERIILYYYFTFTDKHTRSRSSLVRSLVIQTCQQDERAQKDLEQLYKRCSRSQPSDEELLGAFNTMISRFNHVMVVLDGLDELERDNRPEVLQWIRNTRADTVTPDIRILASSRSEHDIEVKLKGLHLELELLPGAIQWDIIDYVRKHIYDKDSELRRWREKPEVQEEIENTLIEKSRGMFRWVVCQMQAIGECLDRSSLRETLNGLPKTLDETYNRTIQDLLHRNHRGFITLLQFLAFAEEPLSLGQAVDIVAVDLLKSPSFDPKNRMPEQLEIRKVCSSLVVYGQQEQHGRSRYISNMEKTIHLSHFSVKEYLVSDRLPHTLQEYFSEGKAHVSIVNISLGYLTSVLPLAERNKEKEIERHREKSSALPRALDLASRRIFPPAGDIVDKEYPLLSYAGRMWLVHAKNGERNEAISEKAKTFFEDTFACKSWLRNFPSQCWFNEGIGARTELTPLSMSIRLRLERTALWLISECAQIEAHAPTRKARCSSHKFSNCECSAELTRSEMYLASSTGLYEVVRALISRGIDVHGIGGDHGTPLSAACHHGHVGVSSLLLDYSDDSREDYGQYIRSALYKAIGNNMLQTRPLVHPLLRRLIHISIRLKHPASNLGTCLRAALHLGDTHLAKALIEKGASVDESAENISELVGNGENLLLNALEVVSHAYSGDIPPGVMNKMAQGDTNKGSLLHELQSESFHDALETLVSHGARRDITDRQGRTVLMCAVSTRDSRATRILLDLSSSSTTADHLEDNEARYLFVNIPQTSYAFTPLHTAVQLDCTEIVQMLLSRGADVKAIDSPSRMTPAHIAAQLRHLESFKLLVQGGSDLKSRGYLGRTPLDYVRKEIARRSVRRRSNRAAISRLRKFLECCEGRGSDNEGP